MLLILETNCDPVQPSDKLTAEPMSAVPIDSLEVSYFVPREALDLFISYARVDEALRRELEKHLSSLKREGLVHAWHDHKIVAGDEWQGEIDQRLDTADLILLLVSSSFIASDYCYDVEADRALKRHDSGEARVIPIIVDACDWKHSKFFKLQALPRNGKAVTTWSNRNEAWRDVTQGLREAIAASSEPFPRPPELPRSIPDPPPIVEQTNGTANPGEERGTTFPERRWVFAVSVLAALAVLAVAPWSWLRPDRPEPPTQSPVETTLPVDVEKPRAGKPMPGPIGMSLRRVLAGTFSMGSPFQEAGRGRDELQHPVRLTRDFLIAETEVTQGQWRELMGNNPSEDQQCGEDCRVENVSWYEALRFANSLSEIADLEKCYQLDRCNELGNECDDARFRGLDCKGYRLPTEAEWEAAARTGAVRALDADAQDNQGSNNAPLLDRITCTVWEWVWDWKGDYRERLEAEVDPIGPATGSVRVVRGGTGYDDAHGCRSARREERRPEGRYSDVGFRVVRTAD